MVFAQKKLISPRARFRRVTKIFAAAGELIIVANFLFFVATWTTTRPGVRITDVSIAAGNAIDKVAVRTIVDTALSKRILWRIRRDNIALYPRTEITHKIAALDKRISSVAVSANGIRALRVTVNEYQPAKLWCHDKKIATTDESSATTTEQCYYADSIGYIFSESPQYLGTTFPVYRTKLAATATPIGSHILPADKFARIEVFVAALAKQGVIVQSVREEEGGDYNFATNYPWSIEWSISEDPNTSADNLALVLDAITKNKGENGSPVLIDLRFGNKVFYK